MFYDGDLQSGISKALQESKLVTCFVAGILVPNTTYFSGQLADCDRPDGDVESRSWENDFLEDPSVSSRNF